MDAWKTRSTLHRRTPTDPCNKLINTKGYSPEFFQQNQQHPGG
jgi:hypothetical protein